MDIPSIDGRRPSIRRDRGVSSTLSTILLIAIVVSLAITVGRGAMFSAETLQQAPQTSFAFEFTNDGTVDELVVKHEGGDTISGGQLEIVITDATPNQANGRHQWTGSSLNGDDRVSTGSSVTLNSTTVGDGSTLDLDDTQLRVVWEADDGSTSAVIARWSASA